MIERPQSKQPIPPHAKKVFTGVLFDAYQWEQEQFDGSIAIFEKLKREDTVCVITALPDKKLLIVEDEQPGRDMVITFPGGRIDPGEDAETAARRELLEETGYEPGELIYWKGFQPVSKVDWVLYFFIARNSKKVTEQHLDPGERIKSRIITFDEFLTLLDDPNFQGKDLKTDFMPAHYDPEERKRLEEILFGV